MVNDEYTRAACWVVCPMCDAKRCVGREKCPEIKEWADRKREADNARAR